MERLLCRENSVRDADDGWPITTRNVDKRIKGSGIVVNRKDLDDIDKIIL